MNIYWHDHIPKICPNYQASDLVGDKGVLVCLVENFSASLVYNASSIGKRTFNEQGLGKYLFVRHSDFQL